MEEVMQIYYLCLLMYIFTTSVRCIKPSSKTQKNLNEEHQ